MVGDHAAHEACGARRVRRGERTAGEVGVRRGRGGRRCETIAPASRAGVVLHETKLSYRM